jgi:predicted acetyltransferase
VVDAQIAIEQATPADAALLANLLELYIHDLSEVFPVEPGADGRFGYPKLALYWSEPEQRLAFLIREGTKTVGFALVTRGSPASDEPDVLDVAEFFVLRRHRRQGCGQRAAALLFDRLPGRWIVRVSEGNRGALRFWESIIVAYTGGQLTRSAREGSPHAWRDLSFVAPANEAAALAH